MILLEARLSNSSAAALEARKLVAGLRAEVPQETLDDMILLVSEIVTNSHRHAGMPPDGTIGIRVSRSRTVVRVEVADGGARMGSKPWLLKPSDRGGWGLHIVDNIAKRWGVESREHGTVVWFEVPVAGGNGRGRRG